KPVSYTSDFPFTPAVAEKKYPAPVISLRSITKPVQRKVGGLTVEVKSNPLTVVVTNAKGQRIQELSFQDDGRLSFALDEQPVLGMGEGGPKPIRGIDWRTQAVQYDRRGAMD